MVDGGPGVEEQGGDEDDGDEGVQGAEEGVGGVVRD